MIYLSAGHHPGQTGASNPELNLCEHDECIKVVDILTNLLGNKHPITLVPRTYLSRKIKFINDECHRHQHEPRGPYRLNVALEVHFNACPRPNDGSGMEVLYYNGSKWGSILASKIHATMLEYLPFKPRGTVARGDELGFLKQVFIPAVIVEPLFINNRVEANFLLNPRAHEIIAKAIAAGVLCYIEDER